MITIRKAQRKDLQDIHQLVYELALYEKEPDAFTATLADYERDFEAGIFEALVAETTEGIVGMALFYMSYSTWKGRMLFLEDFIVKETFRGRGIGQLLFDAFLEEARKKGARLAKWQILDWNQPALDFYRKNKATIEQNWWNGKIFLKP